MQSTTIVGRGIGSSPAGISVYHKTLTRNAMLLTLTRTRNLILLAVRRLSSTKSNMTPRRSTDLTVKTALDGKWFHPIPLCSIE